MDCFASLAMTAGAMDCFEEPVIGCAFARPGMTASRLLRFGCFYPNNTASAQFTASALSITVRSSEAACTEMFSAKNRASVT